MVSIYGTDCGETFNYEFYQHWNLPALVHKHMIFKHEPNINTIIESDIFH